MGNKNAANCKYSNYKLKKEVIDCNKIRVVKDAQLFIATEKLKGTFVENKNITNYQHYDYEIQKGITDCNKIRVVKNKPFLCNKVTTHCSRCRQCDIWDEVAMQDWLLSEYQADSSITLYKDLVTRAVFMINSLGYELKPALASGVFDELAKLSYNPDDAELIVIIRRVFNSID